MFAYELPETLVAPFVALTMGVVAMDVVLVAWAAPPDRRARWAALAAIVAPVWLAAHAVVAESGVLNSTQLPPPMGFYLAAVVLTGGAVAGSRVGQRLAGLPWAVLIGAQVFRLPLEIWLHRLHDAGGLPVQMTWSANNQDVWTALIAIPVAIAASSGRAPRWLIASWNVLGSLLLINVVTVALLSTPMPFRQFTEGPAVLLPFHAPSNWIVNVHVWTALVAHLVMFRKLWSERAP